MTATSIKPLKIPSLTLQRLPFSPKLEPEMMLKHHRYFNNYLKTLLENLDMLLTHPEDYLYKFYESEGKKQELEQLQMNYSSYDKSQKILVYMFLKPSVIISEKYHKALVGDYLFTASDFIEDIWLSSISFALTSSKDWFAIAVKQLPTNLQKAFLLGENPLTYWCRPHESYSWLGKDTYSELVLNLWRYVALDSSDKALLDSFFERYLPTIRQTDNKFLQQNLYAFIADFDHPKAVEDILHFFTTKKLKPYAERYFTRFPQTLINECLYLMFTPANDESAKKAKKHANVFFDWLLEHDKPALLQAIQMYDNQL